MSFVMKTGRGYRLPETAVTRTMYDTPVLLQTQEHVTLTPPIQSSNTYSNAPAT